MAIERVQLSQKSKKKVKLPKGCDKDQLLQEFRENLNKGQEVFREKHLEIRRSRFAEKQIIPDESLHKSTNTQQQSGNDPNNDGTWGNSAYEVPLGRAIGEKIVQELTTNIFDHEYGGNSKEGRKVRRAIKRSLRKIYSSVNLRRKFNNGLLNAVFSGTFIAQTITKNEIREIITSNKDENGEYIIDQINLGRIIDLMIYDPLTVIPDFNAYPHDINGTMQWCIVTVGEFTKEYIEAQYGVELLDLGEGRGNQQFDNYKREVERNAGLRRDTQADATIVVREYYKKDGIRYTFAGDSQLLDVSVNSNGIKGRVPIMFAPIWLDNNNIFGQTLESLLRPSIDVLSGTMNQIIDLQTMNVNMPWFADAAAIPSMFNGMTLNEFSPRQVIPVENVGFNGVQYDVNKAFGRPQLQELTQGSMFVYQECIKMIWYLTGFNEVTLGGIQGKQIRNADVANMINEASLKNSSKIVVQIETELMNPMAWDILQIFNLHYDDFPDLKENGVSRDVLRDFKNVRVINGSSLPTDQINRVAKIERMLQIGQFAPQSVDWRAILEDWFDAVGVADESIYLLDPLQVVTEQQAGALLQLVQEQGIEAAMQYIQGIAQQGGQPVA